MQVNMHDAKSQLSKLVAAAEAGEVVEIAGNGRSRVRLVPITGPVRRLGQYAYLGPVGDAWDSPELNAELAALFEGSA